MTEKSSKEKIIATQYAELNRFGQNGEYERALKAANKILGVAPQEGLAFHCKIICFIQLGKFEDAITLLNKNPQFLQNLIFEKAYCYYRANKPEDALATIDQSETEIDFRTKELKAQTLYRLEKFNEAAEIYREIIKNSNDDYEDERYTNLSAALVYLTGEGNWKLQRSRKKLRQCEKLCREVLEEDEATEEEIDIELALIRIQLGYVYQKQGRIKEAQQLYVTNLKAKLEDIALTAVASNNIVCINKDQNLFDSKRKMKVALNEALVYKLPSKQRKYISLNNAIFNYYINQLDQCEKICNGIEENWPDLSIQTAVIKALNLVKSGNTKGAIELLKKFKSSTDSFLQNSGKSWRGQLQTRHCWFTYHLISWGLEMKKLHLNSLKKTVEFYKENKMKDVDLSSLWRQAAEFHIKNGHPQVAANSLEELLRANKNDKKVTAQLVLACTQSPKLSKELPTVAELSKDVDLDSLQTITSNTVSYKKSPAVSRSLCRGHHARIVQRRQRNTRNVRESYLKIMMRVVSLILRDGCLDMKELAIGRSVIVEVLKELHPVKQINTIFQSMLREASDRPCEVPVLNLLLEG
ncbi:hypothetical protein NQ318_001723 [Aromia moschata]|uniref:Signal recognition particle subunit SRP72 n=1 Tax=Aromia moschata TaxID=1265417 RepID=A0AAV8XUD3_9CUCU|nr:hypothetical protein NQ318_001723 [Aromia moschata]